MTGLPVSRLIRASINLSPIAAARRGFGILLVAGDTDVIDGSERVRSYTSLEGVLADFSTTDPEYKAAVLYFGQSPRPSTLMIGRWIESDSMAILYGGALSASDQTIGVWNAVTAGAFKITVGGSLQPVGSLNFSTDTNMTQVAARINTALQALTYPATCIWNGSKFVFESDSVGASSSISYLGAPAAGTDISAMLKGTAAYASVPVPGYDAETPVECAEALAIKSALWFGLTFASTEVVTDDEHTEVAALIEGLDLKRIYCITSQDADILDSTVTNDIASTLKDLAYDRTSVQYSSSSHYAIVSMVSRAFSVNFAANRSTITLMYKTEPGVVAEVLTETQAQTLKDKNCNVYAEYVNDTAIIQYGVMSSGAYFDEIHGLSWFEDALQNSVYNLLYTSKTKIPQTDAGTNMLIAACTAVCKEAVNNGLSAPGVWNADGFGQLQNGEYLTNGYYFYASPMALQPQAERETRTAPPIQIALKLAGAIHEVDLIVDVNR